MAFDAKTERLISLKKLSGKAHTSNDKGLPNEGLPSGITMSTATIFAEAIPGSPTATPYQITGGIVEFLRLPVSFILGSDTSDGRHGFELKLPSDYESNSSNPNAGSGVFVNNKVLNTSNGKLQLIPPSFATAYEAKPHYGSIGSGTRIYLLDARDWNLDYFNGVLFQQTPPGTGDHAQNPTYVEAYIYIGDYLDGSSGADGDITAVVAGTGLSGGASSGSATLNIDNTVVATLTGSNFTGNVVAQSGLSGSLQNLADGSSYLVEGSNISIVSGSNGSITISASASGSAFKTISVSGQSNVVADAVSDVLTLSGSNGVKVFTNASTDEVRFNLDLISGENVSIVTGSNGSVTINAASELRNKKVYSLSNISAGNNVEVSSTNFQTVNYKPESVDVFLNGLLMHSGSSIAVGNSIADYYVSGPSTLRFAFDIENLDVLDVILNPGGGVATNVTVENDNVARGTPVISYEASAVLTNERVLRVSDVMSFSTTSAGFVDLDIDRKKSILILTSSISSGTPINASVDFSQVSYKENRIDIFLNGQMMLSGSNKDYVIQPTSNVVFSFELLKDDSLVVTLI